MRISPADAKVLFGQALVFVDPSARAAFLSEACGGNVPLLAEIESLLAAADCAGDFLNRGGLGAADDLEGGPPTPNPSDRPRSPTTIDPTQTHVGNPPAETAGVCGLPAFPGYVVHREIGRGGMGIVFEATHEVLNRTVALKVLRFGGSNDTVAAARFLGEAQSLAAVRHPHVVQVYDYGQAHGVAYLVMERLSGETLHNSLKKIGRLEPRVAAELLEQVARGVGAVHRQGIVHRDLKPSNVLFTADGSPQVTDFGLAKRTASDLTATQAIMGTPAFMSPEQASGRGKFVGPPSDVWSLGVILYECLTGVRPFESEDVLSLLSKVVRESPARPRTHVAGLPRDLEAIVLKCLAKKPSDRYPSADDLADDLLRYLNGQNVSRPRRRVRRAAAVWVLGICLTVAAFRTAYDVLRPPKGPSVTQSGVDLSPPDSREAPDGAGQPNTALPAERNTAAPDKSEPSPSPPSNVSREATQRITSALVQGDAASLAEAERLLAEFLGDRTLPPAQLAARLNEVRERLAAKRGAVSEGDRKWVDSAVQNALSLTLRERLSDATPDWTAIRALVGTDATNCWAKLAEAEQALLRNDRRDLALGFLRAAESLPAPSDLTAEDCKTYGDFLRGLATKNEEAAASLEVLFRPAVDQLPPLLRPEFRRKATAEALAANAIPFPKTPDDLTQLLAKRPNPYDGNPKALERLQIAYRLAGKDHPDWAMRIALLAEATGDAAAALAATTVAKFDDTKLSNADVPVAITFLLRKAANTSLRDDDRTQAYAAAARLSLRHMNGRFGPYKTMKPFFDAEDRYLHLIQEQILTPAEAVVGGSRGDKASLRLSRAQAILNGPNKPMDVDRIVEDMEASNHVDLANAYGYRAAYLFFRSPRLMPVGESQRFLVWHKIHDDIEKALRLEPDNRLANYALSFVLSAEFGLHGAAKPPAEKVRPQTDFAADKIATLRNIAVFDKACTALQTRKDTTLWFIRAKFLRAAANDFAFAPRSPDDASGAANVKTMLEKALDSVRLAQGQRDTGPKSEDNIFGRRHDESLVEGRILEDFARLTKIDAAEVYELAIEKMKFVGTRTSDVDSESLVDMARCTIRAVESGAFDESRLTDAEKFLTDLAGSEKAAGIETKSAVKQHFRCGNLWRAVLHQIRKEHAAAERVFEKAVADFQANEAEAHLLATALVYRGENAIDGLASGEMTPAAATKIVHESASQIDTAINGPRKTTWSPTMSFVSDYLRGRLAAEVKDFDNAVDNFRKAYDLLRVARDNRTLRVEEAFALRCLAHSLFKCAGKLGDDERKRHADLLVELERQYEWVLRVDDRALVIRAKDSVKR